MFTLSEISTRELGEGPARTRRLVGMIWQETDVGGTVDVRNVDQNHPFLDRIAWVTDEERL